MDSNEDDAWKLARELVQIDSSDPGAYEGEIERRIRAWLRQRIESLPESLASRVSIEELEVLPGRTELMATIPGTTDEPRLVFICHMDTVTLGDGWDDDIDPLSGLVRDGRLYGRGACDMKSGLASAMVAFEATLEKMARTGKLPRRGLSLICSVDEEDFMRGVEAAIKQGWVGASEWVVDTEPTDSQIQVAHKGRTWFELTMQGVTAHASQPWKGADAIAAMAVTINQIRREFGSQPTHDELGRSTVTFGQIEGGYRPYVVPDSCKVWIDMRLVPPCDTQAATKIVQNAIATAENEVEGCHGSYVITGDRPAVERDPASPLLAELLESTADVTGTSAEVGIFTGYTDTAVIAGTCQNHNCMSYGPGSLALAHKPNEYVPLEDVRRAQAVLTRLAERVCW
ncbi:M20 family metallopeptidase [uncultured Parolsenella sp.]|mgnify:FL=1|uniref:M20 family metallopeptidase n=1 Tax=uncultured Parolsenella sp. TaxID=2083008 RepID=UPI0025D85BF7|nr:M20 family metallopeptidase [uncultured Parolsenella sp.]